MLRISGRQLYLYAGGNRDDLEPICASISCSLSLSVDSMLLCRQESFRRLRPAYKSWEIECSRLCYLQKENPIFGLIDNVGQPLSMAISVLQKDICEAGIDISNIKPTANITLVGRVIPSSMAHNGRRGQMGSNTISFLGCGELGILVDWGGFPYILPIVF